MQYNDYPKHMSHPAFKAAVVVKWDPKIKDSKDQAQGSPARFPPVIVHNMDQEQQYASLGYRPNGVSDPDAYRKAMTGNDTRPDNMTKEYPKYLYRAAANEEGFEAKLVSTKPEEDKLGRGWHRTPDLARAAGLPSETPPPAAAPVQPPKAAPVEARVGVSQTPVKTVKKRTAKKSTKKSTKKG